MIKCFRIIKIIYKKCVAFYKNFKSIIIPLVLLFFLLGSIVLFVYQSVQLNKNEIWFSNMDQDSFLLIESMRINSENQPIFLNHPALGVHYLYGKFLKLFEIFNIIPVSEFNRLSKSNDPLLFLPDVFYKGRTISIIISISCALIFGFIFYVLTQKLLFFTLSTILFLFSGGLFFQSLLVRSELTSVFFVLISLFLLVLFWKTSNLFLSSIIVIISGVFFGFAALSKIQVLPIFVFIITLLLYNIFRENKVYSGKFVNYKIFQLIFVIMFLGLYIVFLNSVYNKNSMPVSLIIIILFIFLSPIIFLLPWFKGRKISLFFYHLNLFLIGFLISFKIAFYLVNMSSSKSITGIFDLVFHSGKKAEVTLNLLSSLNRSIEHIYSGVVKFSKYYFLESYLLIFIILLFIITKKKFNSKAIVTLVFGVGYCFFSSLRHFGLHYLIYSDMFFCASFIFLLISFFSSEKNHIKDKTTHMKNIIRLMTLNLMDQRL